MTDLIQHLEAEAITLAEMRFPELSKLLLDARDEIVRLREVVSRGGGGWLPIESAPKRTKVLVAYQNRLGNWRRVIAKYYGENELMNDPDYSDEEFAEAGWYECVENGENINQTDEPPTLWQPLPPPPAKAAPLPPAVGVGS